MEEYRRPQTLRVLEEPDEEAIRSRRMLFRDLLLRCCEPFLGHALRRPWPIVRCYD